MKNNIEQLRQEIENILLDKINNVSTYKLQRFAEEGFNNFIRNLTAEIIEEMNDTLDPLKIEETSRIIEEQMLDMITKFKITKLNANNFISKPYKTGFEHVSEHISENFHKYFNDERFDKISKKIIENITESFDDYTPTKALKNKIISKIIEDVAKTKSSSSEYYNFDTLMLSLINSSVGIDSYFRELEKYSKKFDRRRDQKKLVHELETRKKITNMGVEKFDDIPF